MYQSVSNISINKPVSKFKLIKRGVKEVNKYFRKQQEKKCNALCILAGDVSPVDVICHIPILCEKRKVPYIYIPSRQALGTASQTKRPTSVILLLEPPEDNNYCAHYHKIKDVLLKYQE